MAEFRLVVRAVVYTVLLMSIIIMPIGYNTYDLSVQKQEYDANISLLEVGYQTSLIRADIELRKVH
jgi:hypothetical protein